MKAVGEGIGAALAVKEIGATAATWFGRAVATGSTAAAAATAAAWIGAALVVGAAAISIKAAIECSAKNASNLAPFGSPREIPAFRAFALRESDDQFATAVS